MTIKLHKNDLPDDVTFSGLIAVDTETLGLKPLRDRLCLIQLSAGDGTAHIVQFTEKSYNAPNLKAVLANKEITKIFHFARFDLAVIFHYLKVMATPLFCTKIASKLVRTYTDRHGLKDLCRELLSIELSKQQQSSDWAADNLTKEQLSYAASDVLYLHQLKDKLEEMLKRQNRSHYARDCFEFVPTRAELDLAGWAEEDIFSH